MASKAIHTVIYESIYLRMIEVGCVATAMAGSGAGKHGVIRGVSVASSANPVGIAMIHREKGVVGRG